MEPLTTLFDDAPKDATVLGLTPDLAMLYGGNLMFPSKADRPFVYANFVTSLDGVVSFNLPDRDTGNAISGGSAIDHVVMGILRAHADAVIWGAASYQIARKFTPTPEGIWRRGAERLREQCERLGKRSLPLAVVVTASGKIDHDGAIFQRAEQPALVVTTDAGAIRLADLTHTPNTTIRSVGVVEHISPSVVLRILHEEFEVKFALHEGGPTLFGAFMRDGVVDELFLTLAPQMIGRADDTPRPGLIEGEAFFPTTAPWARLLSLKRGGSHLFMRYGITGPRNSSKHS